MCTCGQVTFTIFPCELLTHEGSAVGLGFWEKHGLTVNVHPSPIPHSLQGLFPTNNPCSIAEALSALRPSMNFLGPARAQAAGAPPLQLPTRIRATDARAQNKKPRYLEEETQRCQTPTRCPHAERGEPWIPRWTLPSPRLRLENRGIKPREEKGGGETAGVKRGGEFIRGPAGAAGAPP